MWPLESIVSEQKKDIGGKTWIFQLNLGMWPLKSIVLEKRALFWGFQHTFLGFFQEIDGKTFIFRVNLSMWDLKSIVSEKQAVYISQILSSTR